MEAPTETPPQQRPKPGDERGAPPPQDLGTEGPPKKGGRPPLVLIIVGAIVLIAALIWGVRFLAYATTHETTDDARVDADTVTITSKISEKVDQILVDTNAPVKKGQILIRLDDTDERNAVQQAQAALQAQQSSARAAQESVSLTRATVQAQATQGAGGIAAAKSGISTAQAQAQSAQQQAAAARSAIGGAQAQLRVAQSQVPATKAGLDRANADLNRYAALVRTGDIASQTLDAQRAAQAQAQSQYQSALDSVTAAQTAVAQAQARYTSALASTTAATAGIGSQEGQLQTAEGRLSESDSPYRVSTSQAQADAALAQARSLQAQVKTAQDHFGYTVIRSPIDGYVGAKNVEVGTAVAAGQSLMNLIPSSHIYITANYKETQLGNMRVGQSVDVKVDAYKKTDITGKVCAIAPASQNTFSLVPAQNATGNFVKVTQRIPIRVCVDDPSNSDHPLRVGMSVETSVKVK